MPSANREVTERAFRAWNDGDLTAWMDCFDPFVVMVPLEDHPDTGPMVGLEAALEFAAAWTEPYESCAFSVLDVDEHGDRVIVVTRQKVRTQTGVELEDDASALLSFGGGRVAQMRWFNTPEQARAALAQ